MSELKEITQDVLTVDQLKVAVPQSLRVAVTPDLVNQINSLMADPELRDHFRENLIGFSSVLKEGKFKLLDYINATRYVCYKSMGDTNALAYAKTFPDRYQALVDKNMTSKEISAYVSSYSKSKLVTMLLEQVLVPMHIMYDDYRHQAIKQLMELTLHASSEKVQSDSADRLLTHLKPPEQVKLRLELDNNDKAELDSMRESMRILAARQKEQIDLKMSTAKEVAEMVIIQGEASRVI